MLTFIGVIAIGFSYVGQATRQAVSPTSAPPFVFWALGSTLFAFAVSFLAISYWDQSVMFLYMTLAAISSCKVQESTPAVSDIRKRVTVGIR